MKALHLLVRAAILLAPVAAAGAGELPAAADPGGAVPATRYQGVLPYRSTPAPLASPDRNWKELNRTVGATNSMMLTMEPPAEPPAPATEPAPAAVPPAGQPMHHHQHEASQ